MHQPPESVPCGQQLHSEICMCYGQKKKVFLINLIWKDAASFFLFFKCYNPDRMTRFDIRVGSMMPNYVWEVSLIPSCWSWKVKILDIWFTKPWEMLELEHWCERLLTWQLSWRLTAPTRRGSHRRSALKRAECSKSAANINHILCWVEKRGGKGAQATGMAVALSGLSSKEDSRT